jgi:hypothetical protein
MKSLFWIGLVCVVLGLLSFVVDVPRTQKQTFQADGVRLGVSRTEERKLPAVVGGTLIVGGLALMIAGSRESKP